MEKEKYAIEDFFRGIEKYNDIYEKKWTQAEIATIIAQGMIGFFPHTGTSY